MTDTFLRQWHMLQMIPYHPDSICSSDLLNHLTKKGFAITMRTLQRDLTKLSGPFPLVCNDRSRPFKWSWMSDSDHVEPHKSVASAEQTSVQSSPRSKQSVRFKGLFSNPNGLCIESSHLSGDIHIEPQPNGSVLLTTECFERPDLIAWLASFGDRLEIIEPARFRTSVSRLSLGVSSSI